MNIKGLHHYAYRCRDAEETRVFYEDLLGLPLAHLIRLDHVPSTGEYCPYVHVFFEMQDGSFIAFFDLGDNERAEPSANTPAWVNHLALEVPDREELLRAKARLEAAGVEVLGVTDHHIIESIYFFDPNGHRLELACNIGTPDQYAELRALAPVMLNDWAATKRAPRHAAWLHEDPAERGDS